MCMLQYLSNVTQIGAVKTLYYVRATTTAVVINPTSHVLWILRNRNGTD